MLKRILRSDLTRGIAARLVGLYLVLALRTTRWRMEADAATLPYLTGQDGRVAIIAFWHEFLPLSPALWWWAQRRNPALPMHVLISRHRDGRLISQIVGRWQVRVIAGSSDRDRHGGPAVQGLQSVPRAEGRQSMPRARGKGGAAALRGLIAALRSGGLVAITPDGPRGPRRVLQPGAARAAALAGVPVIPVAAHCRHLRLRSWDRMMLPLPFGRGVLVCGAPIAVPAQGWEQAVTVIGRGLDDVAAQALR